MGGWLGNGDGHLESGAESDAWEFRLHCVAVRVWPVCSSGPQQPTLQFLISCLCYSGTHSWQFSFFYSLYMLFRNSRVAVQILLYLHISSGSCT